MRAVPKLEVYDAAEAIPDGLREYYVERDGKWFPDADGLGETGKRTIQHENRQRAEAVKRAEAAERKIQTLVEQIDALEAARAKADAESQKPGDAAAKQYQHLSDRLKAAEQKLADAEKKAADQAHELQQRTISDALRTAALEAGVAKGAVEDLVSLQRFRKPWRLSESGELAPYDEGGTQAWPDDPKEPNGPSMTPKTYVGEYLKSNPHWLPPSAGSGAQGNGAGRASGGVITVKKSEVQERSAYEKVHADAAKRGAVVQYIDG